MLLLNGDIQKGAADRGTDTLANIIGSELGYTVVTSVFCRTIVDFDAARPQRYSGEYDHYYDALQSIVREDSVCISLRSEQMEDDIEIVASDNSAAQRFLHKLVGCGYKVKIVKDTSSVEYSFLRDCCALVFIITLSPALFIKDDTVDYKCIMSLADDLIKSLKNLENDFNREEYVQKI